MVENADSFSECVEEEKTPEVLSTAYDDAAVEEYAEELNNKE